MDSAKSILASVKGVSARAVWVGSAFRRRGSPDRADAACAVLAVAGYPTDEEQSHPVESQSMSLMQSLNESMHTRVGLSSKDSMNTKFQNSIETNLVPCLLDCPARGSVPRSTKRFTLKNATFQPLDEIYMLYRQPQYSAFDAYAPAFAPATPRVRSPGVREMVPRSR